MQEFAQLRMKQNTNPNRATHDLLTNSCVHFAKDVVEAGGPRRRGLVLMGAIIMQFRQVALICFLSCAIAFSGCTREEQPTRPSGVPPAAVWVGGADGGVFILLERTGAASRAYRVSIYNANGERETVGEYWLDDAEGRDNESVTVDLLEGWDGERVLLSDGRMLKPAK